MTQINELTGDEGANVTVEPGPLNADQIRTGATQNLAGGEATANQLTGDEDGLWHIHTAGSLHVFDLDAGTVERRLGASAAVLDSVGPRPLRAIINCTLGVGGHWTLESDDPRFTYFLHSSSTIERVERVEWDS